MPHTPGPWQLVRDPIRGVAIQARADSPSACHIAYVQFAGTDIEDGLSNATLIAAAPTLLKACRLALLEFERNSYQKKADPDVVAAIEAAVTKAEVMR